jgi:hypothetical protein
MFFIKHINTTVLFSDKIREFLLKAKQLRKLKERKRRSQQGKLSIDEMLYTFFCIERKTLNNNLFAVI